MEKKSTRELDATKPNKPTGLEIAGGVASSGAIFAITGIPLPPVVARRLTAAMGRMVDVTADTAFGWLERYNAKLKFEAQTQQDITRVVATAGANQIASNEDREAADFARGMLLDYGVKRKNKAMILDQALAQLEASPQAANDAGDDIDADWLNHFSSVAEHKSSPDLQALLGRILAGEIRKPGSFSLLSISVLSSMSQSVAQKFVDLCSVSVGDDEARFIEHSLVPKFQDNGIPELDFKYTDLLLLRQHNLVSAEIHTTLTLKPDDTCTMANCDGSIHGISTPVLSNRVYRISVFTLAGNEICRLLDVTPPDWFNKRLETFLASSDWTRPPPN